MRLLVVDDDEDLVMSLCDRLTAMSMPCHLQGMGRPPFYSRYQTCLLKWFDLWGWKLEPKEPTLLDLAILQTNLFFTKSKRFRSGFDGKQWQYAFERLCAGIVRFNISGLLITSTEVGDHFVGFSKTSIIPQWDRAIGTPLSWCEPGSDTLRLVIGKTTVLNIAIMNHPASGVADRTLSRNVINQQCIHGFQRL